MIASWENWASVANYVERILRLKKRDLEAMEHVGVTIYEAGTWIKEIVENVSPTFNTQSGRGYDHDWLKGHKVLHSEVIPP